MTMWDKCVLVRKSACRYLYVTDGVVVADEAGVAQASSLRFAQMGASMCDEVALGGRGACSPATRFVFGVIERRPCCTLPRDRYRSRHKLRIPATCTRPRLGFQARKIQGRRRVSIARLNRGSPPFRPVRGNQAARLSRRTRDHTLRNRGPLRRPSRLLGCTE